MQVTVRNCNVSIKDRSHPFDTLDIIRSFELDLSNPVERSIGIFIPYLVSNHRTNIVQSAGFFSPKRNEWIDLKLKQAVEKSDTHAKHYLDADHQQLIETLSRIVEATRDLVEATSLFKEIDKNQSGELDITEFSELLRAVGIDIPDEKVAEVMAEFDVDGGMKTKDYIRFCNIFRKDYLMYT